MISEIRNILIPVNFSDAADSALFIAIAMCKRHKANLHLLHIETERRFKHPLNKNPSDSISTLKARVEIADKLEMQARQIEHEHQINCLFHTDSGSFYEVLNAKAKDFYSDMIVLQLNKKLQSLSFFGKNSVYKVLQHVSCPVLTIPAGNWPLNFKNILFPVRRLPSGLLKFKAALPIIKSNNAKVSVLAAVGPLRNIAEMTNASEIIQQADHLLSGYNIAVEKEINSSNDAAKEVVNRAIEKASDLIIISASVKRGFSSFFLQNYTQKVISRSPIPVLSVKEFNSE